MINLTSFLEAAKSSFQLYGVVILFKAVRCIGSPKAIALLAFLLAAGALDSASATLIARLAAGHPCCDVNLAASVSIGLNLRW